MREAKMIQTMEEFSEVLKESHERPVLLCKFSPVCSISTFVKNEFQRFLKNAPDECSYYSIDVIYSRAVARDLAEEINVRHQSPQALLLRNGVCVWNDSHMSLTMELFGNKVSEFIKDKSEH